MTISCEAERTVPEAGGMRRFLPGDGAVACFYDGCTPLLCWRGRSQRTIILGRLDPPFRVHEHDGTVTEEPYCQCSKNELGLKRLFLVPGDAYLFRAFDEVMLQDAGLPGASGDAP